ncbi:MAG: TRAP transporter substrate-binding protein [Proteobacteria bacterium]|nr:TRAP transporter substrate-binding protein [Pseudomonadota bacterium]
MTGQTKNQLSRRQILSAGAAVAGTAALAACDNQTAGNGVAAPAVVTGRRNLRLVTTWPPNFPGIGAMPVRFADRVREATEGALDFRIYAAGELVPALEAFDAVSNGAADAYHGAEYYWQGKSPGFNFFAAVPMGLTAGELSAWIYYMGGQELWDELSAGFSIKPFLCGNTGAQLGGWFKRRIDTLDDLRGLRMRIPGLSGGVMARLGVAPVTLAGGDIFLALQSGTIDATEWIGPWNDMAFGFHRVARYYCWPGFQEGGTGLSLGFNLDVWNSLTPSQQVIVRSACAAENDISLAEYNARNAQSLIVLRQDPNVEILEYPEEIKIAMGGMAGQVVRDAGDTNELTRRIYDSYMQARTTLMEWSVISDDAFLAMRRLNFVY